MIHGIYLTNYQEPPCPWMGRVVSLLFAVSASTLLFGFVVSLFK